MSITRLPRGLGIIVRCDGSDDSSCCEKLQTANVYAKSNRSYAVEQGWGRGLRRGRKRRDQCPAHLAIERAAFDKAKADHAAQKAKRDEDSKAAFATKQTAK